MKTGFIGVPFSPVGSIPFNYGEIEAKKAIKEVFDNLDEDNDVDYDSEFVKEMNEAEK